MTSKTRPTQYPRNIKRRNLGLPVASFWGKSGSNPAFSSVFVSTGRFLTTCASSLISRTGSS